MATGAQGGDGPDDDPDEPGDQSPDQPSGGIPGFPGFDIPGFDLSQLDLSKIDLGQLAGMLQSSGPLHWDIARQLATAVATEGDDDPPIDPATRAQLDELARAALTHVVAETGLAATFAAPVTALTRAEWAALHLDALRPVLETLATSLGEGFSFGALPEPEPGDPPELGQLAGMLPMLAPVLLGVQAGSMIGYLARHALGRYDLPLPASDEPTLTFVVANLDAFESDWSLDRTDLRFYVAIHEVVHAAARSVPWVRRRLVDLATDYVSGYEIDPAVLESRLGTIDPSDPASIQALADHPEEILGAMQSDRQRAVLEQARVFHATLDGYVDAVLERVGEPLIPSFARIHEAMVRHRIERGEAERFVESLLGLGGDRDDYDRGTAFARGVVERAGPEALHRLWEGAAMEPTPNELAAPGLWLARIELDDDDPGTGTGTSTGGDAT